MTKTFQVFYIIIFFLIAASSFAEEVQLETVTVTAEKRTSDSQKVAIPMNVMSEFFIQDTGMKDLTDMGRFVPNIIIDDNIGMDQTWVYFRGMSPNEFLATNAMVLNVDGMSTDSKYGFSTYFDDIEQIEVLRGPQGTLYGKNAISGAINITTKKPGNEVAGMVGFSAEERGGLGAKFSVSGPVKHDLLSVGITGGYRQTDGYMDDKTPGAKDDIDGTRKYHYSMKLRATPGKDNDIFFRYSRDNARGTTSPANFEDSHSYDIYTGLAESEYKDDSESVTDSLLLNMQFRRDAVNTTSITSYNRLKVDEVTLMGVQSGAVTSGYQKFTMPSFSQEFRFASSNETGFRWLAGLYYDNNKMDVDEMSSNYDFGAYTYKYNWQPLLKSQTYAVFAETTIPFFAERASVTFGGRYEKTNKEMDYRLITSMDGMAFADDSFNVDKDWAAVQGKISFAYELASNKNIYLSVVQGYTPGGFNYTTADPDLAHFDETKSLNYELGIKTKLLNNRLMFNANIFHTEYRDLQILETNYVSGIFNVENAGKAHTTGIETDIEAIIAKGFNVFFSGGIMDAKYDDFEQNGASYDDNYMIGAPKYNATAGSIYRHPSGFMGSFDVKYTDKIYFAKENSDSKIQDSYALMNMKIGYESPKGYEIYLYARNLTDQEYFTFMRDGGASLSYNYMGEPRTFGVEVNYRF